jgi:hypothetical protein
MFKTISQSDFCESFKTMGRKNNFSRAGLEALFDYLENIEEETGEKIELDVICLCCEYSEYDNIEEFQDYYGKDRYETMSDIENATTVIKIDGDSFIALQF